MEQIRLDLIPGKSAPVCHASQYDVGRTIRLNLVEGGSEYSIPAGTTAEIHIRKPDNNIISAAVTATQGNKYIDIVTAEQWTACAGTNLCEIVLTNGGNVIGTINFILEVEMDPIDGGTASDSVVENLQAMVNAAVEASPYPADVKAVMNVMPVKWVDASPTVNDGLYNKWGVIAYPSGYKFAKISVNEDEHYKINGNYYGGNFPAYLWLKSDSTVLSYVNLQTTGDFSNIEVIVPADAAYLVVNGYTTMPAAIYARQFVQVAPDMALNYDSVVVGKTNKYIYNDVDAAVLNNPNDIVYVDFGTYETEITLLTTDKKIIGKNRELCILEKTDGDYNHPTIEIAGGILDGLTFIMNNDVNAAQKGYTLHSDNAATSNNTLIVRNCYFYNNLSRNLGMGIRGGEKVLFDNCIFESDDTDKGQNAYIHNSTGAKGYVSFRNCVFHSVKECMQLQGWGSDNEIEWEFINCTFLSDTYGTAEGCVWTDYVSGSIHDQTRLHEFSGKFSLKSTSHGNNVAFLNA